MGQTIIRAGDITDQDLTDIINYSYTNTANRRIGMDIETTGLDFAHDSICTVQIYTDRLYLVHPVNIPPYNILSLLGNINVPKVFHHALFDLSFLMRYLFIPRGIEDTFIMAKMLDPKKQRYMLGEKYSHSLAALVRHYYGVVLDKSFAVSNWTGELTPQQIEYARKDVEYLADMAKIMMREIKSRGLIKQAKTTMTNIPTMTVLKMKGITNLYAY